MKYGKRSPWKKMLSSPFALIALVIVCGILVRATWNINQKASVGSVRLSHAQAEFSKLEQRKNDLSGKVNKLSNDEGLEAEIRTKYRAVKEGESVAVIVENQAAAAAGVVATSTEGWFRRLLHKIGF